ncbi:MAG TPA: hypothetical protein VM328_09250 [Fimbriimonadaceae bacterium]|nr:hypothetical protein [Fimbriimonadaceae bacterium]
MRSRLPWFLLCLALAAYGFRQDGVLLRRELKPDTSETYSMTMKMKQVMNLPTGEMPMDIASTAKLTMKMGKLVPDKGAELEMITSDMDMKFDGPMAEMAQSSQPQMPKEVIVKGHIDARNRLTDLKPVGSGAQAMMMAGSTSMQNVGTFIEFPDRPVKIGDTWEIVIPKMPMLGNEEGKFLGKLVGEKEHEGKPVWVLSMEGVLAIKMDMAEMLKNNPGAAGGIPVQNMLITGTMDVKTQALVEKATGRTLSIESLIKGKQKVEVVDFGMTVEGVSEGTVKLELQKS